MRLSLKTVLPMALMVILIGAPSSFGRDEPSHQQLVSKLLNEQQATWKCQRKAGLSLTRAGQAHRSPSSTYVQWAIDQWHERKVKCQRYLDQHPWALFERDLHKSAKKATLVWGISYNWIHSCMHGEGGHGPSFPVGAAGEHGPMQFLSGTFWRMAPQAWKAYAKRGIRIPKQYYDWDSTVGQVWTAAWAFAHGYSHEWFGRGC